MVLKSNKNFWIDTDWGTATDILGTIIQTLVLVAAIYAILQTQKSLKHSKKALDNNEKALENSQKALEISKSDNEILKKQLEFLYKPELKFDFQNFIVEKNKNTGAIRKGESEDKLGKNITFSTHPLAYDFYDFYLTNTSESDINEVEIENFVYFDISQIEKFDSKREYRMFAFRRYRKFNYLSQTDVLTLSFVRYVQQYICNYTVDDEDDKPSLFIAIKYKSKIKQTEVQYFKFDLKIPSRVIGIDTLINRYEISWSYTEIDKGVYMGYKAALNENIMTINKNTSE